MNQFHEEVSKAAAALLKGWVILYPTDTIWGLGCDATNTKAVARLFKIKQRTDEKGLIALIDDANRLTDYVVQVPEIAYDLINNAANPISIVYPRAKNLAKNAIGKDGSVCIRVTESPFCKALVQAVGKPIASTSANIAGEPTPLFYNQISLKLIASADHVVQLFQEVINIPKATTIIKLQADGTFELIRP